MGLENGHISSDVIALLKSAVTGDINEYSIKVEDFNGQGEGFVGEVIFLCLINNKTNEKKDIIIKQQKTLNGEPLKYTVNAFENEIYFYSDIWLTLEEFYRNTTGKLVSFVPKCVGTSRGQLRRIALENLKLQGFVTYDKRNPFDKEHFSKVFEKYGVFHALSMALKVQNVEEFNRLVAPLLPIPEAAFDDKSFGGKLLKRISHDFQEKFGPDEVLIGLLKMYAKIGPKIVNHCHCEGKLDGILLHGDCWSNNFMFKYDNAGQLKDLRIIDFQIAFSGSPVFDLSYFFYSGGSPETFDNLDYYLKLYHSSLANTLREFGLDAEEIYSFGRLKDEWRKYCKYGFAMGLMLWNVKLADKNVIQIAEPEDLEPFKIADGYQEEYDRRIKDLIWHMYKNYYL